MGECGRFGLGLGLVRLRGFTCKFVGYCRFPFGTHKRAQLIRPSSLGKAWTVGTVDRFACVNVLGTVVEILCGTRK